MEWLLHERYARILFGTPVQEFLTDEKGMYIVDTSGWRNYLLYDDSKRLQTQLKNKILVGWTYAIPFQNNKIHERHEVVMLIDSVMYRFVLQTESFPLFNVSLSTYIDESWWRIEKDPTASSHEDALPILGEVLENIMNILIQKKSYRLPWLMSDRSITVNGKIVFNMLGKYKIYGHI